MLIITIWDACVTIDVEFEHYVWFIQWTKNLEFKRSGYNIIKDTSHELIFMQLRYIPFMGNLNITLSS